MGTTGGFNGGGAPGVNTSFAASGGGGGATDVRQAGSTLANRVVVAGGGGGGGYAGPEATHTGGGAGAEVGEFVSRAGSGGGGSSLAPGGSVVDGGCPFVDNGGGSATITYEAMPASPTTVEPGVTPAPGPTTGGSAAVPTVVDGPVAARPNFTG